MAGPHSYSYQGTHDLPIGRDRAWDLLQQTDLYPKWWPWMRRLEVTGTPLEPGTTFTFRVVAPIPFTMQMEVEVDEAVENEFIRASVRGDLAGTAEMSFEEIDGATAATLSWTVEVQKPRIRTAARAIRPILQWGQNWAVETALRGFLRHIRDGA